MVLIPNPLIIPIGICIGILIAAPVGPVNVLCVQRAIERGFWGGIAAGLGVVIGDGLIALFAALGVNAVSGAIRHHRFAIQVVGGLALLVFGFKLYFTAPRLQAFDPSTEASTSLADFAWDIPQTFLLTISNPAAVLGLFAIFGGVSSFVEVANNVDVLAMVASIMAGSLAWWVCISQLLVRLRHRIDSARLSTINRIGGILLIGFGGLLIGEVVLKSTRLF